ncbi:MAG: UDP-N-acetylmuramoyl-tripeptide--D-alanyl-D-alanine ligase [Caldilineaceae bacterium]|nr:UDP-N-acetylmuramoyl-tripeptide--D-alanyl-D-alanine ligase [Caldilineaceae bacterium]
MRPVIATQITQHTLWQALTGQTPPLALSAKPIQHAVLDNRDTTLGDLFVAFSGRHTDGHFFIGDALRRGAQAIICGEQGRDQARAGGAVLIDCTIGRWELSVTLPADYQPHIPLAYVVDETTAALQKVGAFQRLHRSNPTLRVVGVTGSVGKTSTKELAAAVLQQGYTLLHNRGSLNSEQGLPFTLLGLGLQHERAVLEMGMYDIGEIRTLCTLARPHVGVVTNIGPSHLERLGTMERIVQAKAELVEALPTAEDGGVAILNWDDERVRTLAQRTKAQVFRYGLTPEADLWADQIVGAGLEGLRFRFHHRLPGSNQVESLHARVPLLGRHSVHTALRAAAVGLVENLSWEEIMVGLQSVPGQIRLVVVPGINGSTVIDDTYNASPASTIAALNLLADLEPAQHGRRVAVLGDMLELGPFTDEGHQLVGRRAVDVVDLLVTVGDLGHAIGDEALKIGFAREQVRQLPTHEEAIELLKTELRQDDIVLVKGSRAVGMDVIVTEIIATGERQPAK